MHRDTDQNKVDLCKDSLQVLPLYCLWKVGLAAKMQQTKFNHDEDDWTSC